MRNLRLTSPWNDFDYSKLRLPGKSACVVRYGAFGDMIQSSSIFPALKEQGYSVTVNTTKDGHPIIRNDPHIDCIFDQYHDQVPNDLLGDFWEKVAAQFDKFINLSESVERSLLAVEGEKSFHWHPAFRRLVMDVDYLEATHAIAEVSEYPKCPRFYPSKAEALAASIYRKKLGIKNKVILWTLSGSAVHKYYTRMDQVVARVMMENPNAIIVMVGDYACKIIENAWTKERRIKRKSGKWSIRETLAFMRQCDVVVGTETGVMNAASYEAMKKVLMLSHSSPGNLGKKWVNTSVITPKNTPCYPCHKLHYGWGTCHYDEKSGGALCAANTDPNEVYDAIRGAL